MGVTMKILEAGNGDSILIQCGEDESKMKTILIDGGIRGTYSRVLKGELEAVFKKGEVDLLFVTHTHADHIAGIIDLFEDETIDKKKVERVLFNSKSILKQVLTSLNVLFVRLDNGEVSISSVQQGDTLESLLSQTKWDTRPVSADMGTTELELKEGVKLTFLAPRLTAMETLQEAWNEEMQTAGFMEDGVAVAAKETDYHRSIPDLLDNEFTEDDNPENKSSIAFLLEYGGVKLLLLGDACPSDIVASLRELNYSEDNKLAVDFVKVAHHGSRNNTSEELLRMIECQNFIISTNGSTYNHPDKECLARIIHFQEKPVNFIFNYDIQSRIFSQAEMQQYGFRCLHQNTLSV